MHILGIDITGNKNRLNKIYIRCAGTLTMIVGTIFPMTSLAKNAITTRAPGNDTTVSPGLYQTLYGVAGLDSNKSNYFDVHKCTGSSSCVEPYGTLDKAIQKGCTACIITTEKYGSGCSLDYSLIPGVAGGGTSWIPDACYYTTSGSCAPVVESGTTITGKCYGSLVAPADVLNAMGCTSGFILTSGNINADAGCRFESISMPALSFKVSCPTGYPKNPLPYDHIFIPSSQIFSSLIKDANWTEAKMGDVFAYGYRRWIKDSNGSLVKTTTDYSNANSHYCQYGGCPGIKLIDANANFELIKEPVSSKECTEYGTATWDGTPPNCTVTITSKNCAGVSTDPAGVWLKTCSYNE